MLANFFEFLFKSKFLLFSLHECICFSLISHVPFNFCSNIDDSNDSPQVDLEDDLFDLLINGSHSTTFNELTIIGQVVTDKMLSFKAIKAILINVWDFGTS